MHGYAGHRDEPRKTFVRDWGPSLLFCGLGTYLFVGVLGWVGLIPFYGSLLLLWFAVWLHGFVLWRRARPWLVKVVSQLPAIDRRRFLGDLPPRERRKLKRWLARRRLTERCNGAGPRRPV